MSLTESRAARADLQAETPRRRQKGRRAGRLRRGTPPLSHSASPVGYLPEEQHRRGI